MDLSNDQYYRTDFYLYLPMIKMIKTNQIMNNPSEKQK